MVVIRLSRTGANKRPFYHVVVTNSRSPRDGRYIEKVGYFNPIAAGKDVKLHMDIERINHWLKTGAQASQRVTTLVKQYQSVQAA